MSFRGKKGVHACNNIDVRIFYSQMSVSASGSKIQYRSGSSPRSMWLWQHSSPKQLLIWGRFAAFEWTLPLECLLSAGLPQKHQGRWHWLPICTHYWVFVQMHYIMLFVSHICIKCRKPFMALQLLFVFFNEHNWLNMVPCLILNIQLSHRNDPECHTFVYIKSNDLWSL